MIEYPDDQSPRHCVVYQTALHEVMTDGRGGHSVVVASGAGTPQQGVHSLKQ